MGLQYPEQESVKQCIHSILINAWFKQYAYDPHETATHINDTHVNTQ